MGVEFSGPQGILSTPQSIAFTFNSPIAGTFNAGFSATVTHDFKQANSTTISAIYGKVNEDPAETQAPSGNINAVTGIAAIDTNATAGAATYRGGYFLVTSNNASFTQAIGVDAIVDVAAATKAIGLKVQILQESGVASITTGYGIQVLETMVNGFDYTTYAALRLDDVTVNNGVAISTGLGTVNFGDKVNIAAGKGINLGDTTLKNYQEGTFVPNFSNATIVAGISIVGTYIRSGNEVDWSVTIKDTGVGSFATVGSTTTLTNVPFAANAAYCGQSDVLTAVLATMTLSNSAHGLQPPGTTTSFIPSIVIAAGSGKIAIIQGKLFI